MTPKQWINHVRWLESNNLAICDGVTNNVEISFSVLYPLFIISGISVFLWLYLNYKSLKEKWIRK